MTVVVEMHPDPAILDQLADEWNKLLRRAAFDTIFITPTYQRLWWRYLQRGDFCLLAAREDGGELLGVAPLFIVEQDGAGRVIQTTGCTDVSDYLDWIVARGREQEVLAALVGFLDGPAAPPWERIDMCNVHRDSPTLRWLPELARTSGWTTATTVQEVCPVVDLPGDWETYVESLDGKDRRELRRKMRRAAENPDLDWYLVGPGHDLGTETEAFLDLMAQSAPDKAGFLTPAMRAFFAALIRAAADAGWLQLSFLEWQGQKLAAFLNFVYNNRVLVYNSGLDWQAYPKLGAGIILTAYLIERAIEEGREAYDFLRGDESYKYSFGGVDVTVHRLQVDR
ncbi:MAG: GNAT family N-acetyltransferase [Anaerolineae bacterium]|nr:GNAT family N-acetyltransferase [Anaerolineae bacterium]